jgi:hypothetical protein
MNIYDYIISLISSSPTIKHKNSEDISENDIEETTLLKTNDYTYRVETITESKISPITSRSKTHVPFEKYSIYECGYCSKSIHVPQYLYQDIIFCSIMCRSRHISVVQNTKQNACV